MTTPKTTPPPTPDARCRRPSTSRAGSTLTAAYLYFGVPIALVAFIVALVRAS